MNRSASIFLPKKNKKITTWAAIVNKNIYGLADTMLRSHDDDVSDKTISTYRDWQSFSVDIFET